jgi:hypothetical protein
MISDKSQPVSGRASVWGSTCGATDSRRVLVWRPPRHSQSRNGRPTRGTYAFYRKTRNQGQPEECFRCGSGGGVLLSRASLAPEPLKSRAAQYAQ